MTIQEVRAGIELMPAGAKRRTVERWLLTDLIEGFAGRVLPVEIAIADECGRLVVVARRLGHTPDLGDTLIAATANVAALKLATLNRKRFERLGVELVEF
jgi:predicted nucleic acid-binding protein